MAFLNRLRRYEMMMSREMAAVIEQLAAQEKRQPAEVLARAVALYKFARENSKSSNTQVAVLDVDGKKVDALSLD